LTVATASVEDILFEVRLERNVPVPLQRQLYEGMREAILREGLPPGTRLPSTRHLAARLGVARNTVLNAFEQLMAEGYVETRHGSGTFVAVGLGGTAARRKATPPQAQLSRLGTRLARSPVGADQNAHRSLLLQPGVPALDHLPLRTWQRLSSACLRELGASPKETLGYGWTAGYPPLREAIAHHLRVSRGVRCDASQVLVTAGTQGGIDLTARVLLDEGDAVWFENPGYASGRAVLEAAGQRLVPVPVDGEGLEVERGLHSAPAARLAYVTPSHQYPTGVTMSLARRLALLRWAGQREAWIFEDDYDSEFRYTGHPLAALQGQDEGGRVIYAGTFSKTLFPALRLGYLVLPPALVEPFSEARALIDRSPPLLEQLVLARFLEEGHFARHVRRMRGLYAARRAALLGALRAHMGDIFEVIPSETGLQLAGWLPEGVDDLAFAEALREQGLGARPLSHYALEPLPRGGLNLGFGGADESELENAVVRMRAAYKPRVG